MICVLFSINHTNLCTIAPKKRNKNRGDDVGYTCSMYFETEQKGYGSCLKFGIVPELWEEST